MHDKDYLLSEDTQEWTKLLCGGTKLYGSQYRLLIYLRELNSSAQELSLVTGISKERVRARLKQMSGQGLVEIVETLSDKTVIWGLAENMRRPDVATYPTEATVAARRSRLSAPIVEEVTPVTKSVTRQPKSKDITADLFTPYLLKKAIT